MKLENELKLILKKDIKEATNLQLYNAINELVKKKAKTLSRCEGDKKLYYISAEFLIGKQLGKNLINLGIYDDIAQLLENNGKSIADVEEMENEPSLGNGGLGRLAACFLDSIATLNLSGDGVGLNYHYGLFRQQFKDNKQYEIPDEWLKGKNMLRDTKVSFPVELAGKTYYSHMYDLDVIGYHGNKNTLHLFDLDTVDSSIITDSINFDKTDIAKNLTLFLYPDDSDDAGRKLRIYQQYFMVSNAAQLILKEEKEKGHDLKDLDKYVAIQINDTHPSMVIPELIRLLILEGIPMKTAANIVSNTCAYTNHTVMSEALEKWPMDYIRNLLPRIAMIIEEIDRRFTQYVWEHCNGDQGMVERVRVIQNNTVHMANLAIVGSHSINGVAKIHSEILKDDLFRDFYQLFPERFSNKTNGITPRRWMLYNNPQEKKFLDELIGKKYEVDFKKFEDLMKYVDDPATQDAFLKVKQERKEILAKYIEEKTGIVVDPASIFDSQAKRLHAYKRQLLNVMNIIYRYQRIKSDPNYRMQPHTYLFAAKAAGAYTFAKKVIKLINCVAKVVNNDPDVNGMIKVVFLPNYCVTMSEILVPGTDVSEQISTAGKEASGTGNMKFMMNGAITLGTLDGANVEIDALVGRDNDVIFGHTVEELNDMKYSYRAQSYIDGDERIANVLRSLVDCTWSSDPDDFTLILNEIKNKNDEFFVLADFDAYVKAQEKIEELYQDKHQWAKMCLVNIAKSGYFSSDRTIGEYAEDIWNAEPLKF